MSNSIESRTVEAIRKAQGLLDHSDLTVCSKAAPGILREVESELTQLAKERVETDYYNDLGESGSRGHIAGGLEREQARILRDLGILLTDIEKDSVWETMLYRRLRNWVHLLEEFHAEEIRRFQEATITDYGVGE